MQTADICELKTVIVLSGRKRLPHLEAEIFANTVLAEYYVTNLCEEYSHNGTNSAMDAFCYAADILETRWVEAEPFIKLDVYAWEDYCYFFDIPE